MNGLQRVFVGCCSFLTVSLWGGPFDELTWRNPLPQGNDLWDVVWHGDKYVAVGLYGAVITSLDGTNWSGVPAGSRTSLWAIASDGHQLVANGTPALLSSRDHGRTWEEVVTNQRMGNGIAYGNGVFVAGSEAGDLFTSTNGHDWTKTFSFSGPYRINLAFGNGIMVAVNAGGQVAVSSNGFEWTASACPTYMISLDFSDGRFISTDAISAGNSIWSSSNGLAWVKEHTMPRNQFLYAATSFEGRIIGVGDLIVHNDGGTNWVSQPIPQGDYESLRDTLYRVRAGGGGRIVAVGIRGSVFTSGNGVSWHSARSGTDFLLSRIVRGNGRFVIAAGSVTMLSSNGQNWSFHTNSHYRFEDLTFGRGKFLAAGVGYAPLLISTNGTDWAQTYYSGTWHFMRAVAAGAETFLALGQQSHPVNGNEVTVVSADGENWTGWATPESRGLNTCTHGLGKFVAVGSAGKIGVSTDGSQWAIASPVVATDLTGVAASPSTFVAVGSSTVLKSPDGLTWTAHYIGTNASYYGITYGGGRFVALGQTPTSTGVVSVSSNGVDWMHYGTPVYPASLQKAAYGAGTFVLMGGYGVILQSGRMNPYLRIHRGTRVGEVDLTLRGDPGPYQIEYTHDPVLGSWTPLRNVQLTAEFLAISVSATAPSSFYRAIFLGD